MKTLTRGASLLLAAGALLLPARSRAQDSTASAGPPSAAAATPTPGQMAAARELIGLIRLREAAAAGIRVSLESQIRLNPAIAQYRDVFERWGNTVLTSDEATTAFAELYASIFSEEDLRALIAFYHTPTGQRLAASQADLATRSAEVGRRLAQAHVSELMTQIQQAGSDEKKH